MAYKIKTIKNYQEGIEKMEVRLRETRAEMNKLIESYQMIFSEPLVHITKHVAAGMIQLRWRMPGTQKYSELNEEIEIVMSLVHKESELKNEYGIFYFESKRVSLNTDYSLFFNARKKYKKSKELAQKAMQLKYRSGAQKKDDV